MTKQHVKLAAKLFFLIVFLQSNLWLSAQTETNIEALMLHANEAEIEWNQMRERAENFAIEHDVPLRFELEDGTTYQLVDVVDGQPVFFQTYNLGAAHTTRANELWDGGSLGLDVSGEGYDKIGIWDGGRVRTTHLEFNNTGSARVVQMDGAGGFNDHATHVAGTIAAGGVDGDAKGMIYKGELKTYDWNNFLNELNQAAASGMEISNHSWGYSTGWHWTGSTWVWNGNANVSPVEDYLFGFYSSSSRQLDVVAYNAPYHLIVVATGNDRGEGPHDAGTGGLPEKDGGEDGFDCVDHFGIAKNTLAVGNIREIMNYQDPSQVIVNNSSSWGPADDGRIKPDLVAKGTNVYSPTAANNASYASLTGTSMASPNAAGTLAQLQKLYQDLNGGQPMRAATLKGLAIHTTDEAGPHPGPDYMFGWGVLNAERAAEVILDNEGQVAIDELVLNNGATYEREVEVAGGNPMWVTLSWTDQPGIVQSPSLNPRDPHLRNDLDLRIIGPDGTTYYPWKLDYNEPEAPATNDAKNYVDNVELVYIPMAEAGTYTILVDHEGTLVGGSQAFSLILTGVDDYTVMPSCPEGFADDYDADNAFLNKPIEWKKGEFAASYNIYFGTDGGGSQMPTNIYNGENVPHNHFQYHMEPATTYYLMVVPVNNHGTNEDCTDIWTITTMPAVDDYPYLTDVEDVTVPNLPDFWQALDYSPKYNLKWVSNNMLGSSGSQSIGCFVTDGNKTQFNNWLVSPPLAVDATKEYMVRFKYHGFLPNTPERISMRWGLQADTANLINEAFFTGGIVGGWHDGSALLIPEHDGHIFVAWLADNPEGIGVFLDDFLIEDWGLVGVEESLERQVRVMYQKGSLQVQSEFMLDGVEMKVVNMAGQTIMEQRLPNTTTYQTELNLRTGVYVIHLRSDALDKTTKLFIN